MFTPATYDFLNNALEERKKLLQKQGVFSFAQILTREQFYRNNRLPTEINNSIETQVWDLVWESWKQPTEKNLVFFLEKWTWRKSFEACKIILRFADEFMAIPEEEKIDGVRFKINLKNPPEENREWLEINNWEELEHSEQNHLQIRRTVKKKTKLKLLFDPSRAYFYDYETSSRNLVFLDVTRAQHVKFINLSQGEKKVEELVKEILWLLRVIRGDIDLEETTPRGLREQQEFLQNHFKREFEKLHEDNPQLLARVQNLPWFKFH